VKKSATIALALSGALATGAGLTSCSDPSPPVPPVPANSQWTDGDTVVKDQKDQQNNSYVPGIGYYHSAFHSWFPYPFNWYYPQRGYYYGGSWHRDAYAGEPPPHSRPSSAGWTYARSTLRSFSSETAGAHGAPGEAGFHSVIRGGFGHSFGGEGGHA
jgi:hypothetical protein